MSFHCTLLQSFEWSLLFKHGFSGVIGLQIKMSITALSHLTYLVKTNITDVKPLLALVRTEQLNHDLVKIDHFIPV